MALAQVTKRIGRPRLAAVCIATIALAGCNNAPQGAVSGATAGAVGGLIIGSLTGSAGKGAAIGAVSGAVAGGVIGDQNRRRAEREQSSYSRPREHSTYTPPPRHERQSSTHAGDRAALTRFTGAWEVEGWSSELDGNRRDVTGMARGSGDRDVVSIDITVEPDVGESSVGTLTLIAENDGGVTMTSRFDGARVSTRYSGHATRDGEVITLTERDPDASGMRRRIVIRFLGPREWRATVTDLETRETVSEMTFIRY